MGRAISVKELRANLPKIARDLNEGKDFLLIRRSKPIAEIIPIKEMSKDKKTKHPLLDILINPPEELLISSKKSAVDLVRSERS